MKRGSIANKLTDADRAKRALDEIKRKETAFYEKIGLKKAEAAKRVRDIALKNATREMTVVGRCMLLDTAARTSIEAALKRSDIAQPDVEFLKSRGWSL